MATQVSVGATGNKDIDGLLSGYAWSGNVTYSFPDSASDYESGYGYGEQTAAGFAQISTAQQNAVHYTFGLVEQYTNLSIKFAGTDGADIRIAQSSEANPTAYAYYPNTEEGGDVWFGTKNNYTAPVLGNYSNFTHIHELGHALGLKHAHEAAGPAKTALPTNHDGLEYSVMSYKSWIGQTKLTGYTNEQYGYPTTFMMNDIRALQEMYGADFNTNSSDTVYRWSATTGETFIDGVGQGRPGGENAPASANVIFMTVWDGGGEDTYDFSNYITGITINLNPGASTSTGKPQLAYLGSAKYASGNVYNAMLYKNDARSYIENAIGGSGDDTIVGNAVDNRLDGGAGNDTLTGGAGKDVFVFRSDYGADIVTDFSIGFDQIELDGFAAIDSFADVLGFAAQVGANTVFSFSLTASLTLQNVLLGALSAANFAFDVITTPTVELPNVQPNDIALANLSVTENQSGAVIGAVTVTDVDDSVFTFSVSDPRFEVTGTPGAYVLKLVNGVSLDHDKTSAVNVTVIATDGGGLSVSKTFNIAVNDVQSQTIVGTVGNDVINASRTVTGQSKATEGADVIDAGAGNDTVSGLGGNDIIDGGTGNDILYGDAGDDRITGGVGQDRVYGGAGDDTFVIAGSDAQTDSFAGDAGADTIEVSGSGNVTLSRFDAAASSIEAWRGNGQGVLGTAAADILDFSGLQTVTDLAYVDAGAGNDRLTGHAGSDDLRGGIGNDVISGGGGDDRIAGGAGVDTLEGGAGNDTFVIGGTDAQTDIIRGGEGADTIEVTSAVTLARFDAAASSIESWVGNNQAVLGTSAADNLDFSGLQSASGITYVDGGAGYDRISGSSQADDLRGGVGNDTLIGNAGDDRLTGGAGNDTLDGGAGNDTFVIAAADGLGDVMSGGAGTDAIEIAGTGNVTLAKFDAAAASIEEWHGNGGGVVGTSGGDALNFSGLLEVSNLQYVDGGAGNDTLVGSSLADDLRGGAGHDVLTGGAGDDRLTGGQGYDRFILEAGSGHDVITDFEAGAKTGDVVVFSGLGFNSLESVLNASQQVGADVVIRVTATDTLTLANTQLVNLHANDFNFA